MLLSKIKPSLKLSEFIREYRIVDFKFPDSIPLPSKAYSPRPEHCLQFFPRDMEKVTYLNTKNSISGKRASIIGQHSIVNTRHVGKEFLSFQVVFKPGVLFRITGMPSSELCNKYIDARDVLPGTADVNEKLFCAKSYEQMVSIVETYLIGLTITIKKEIHPVDIISTLMQKEDVSLDSFIKQSFLCHRQFDRKFNERVGISPKQYLQVIRFDRAFRMKNKYPDKDWLSIALHCGYYDYQHLVRDYKLFTGYTPNEFAAIEMQAPERVFGDIEV